MIAARDLGKLGRSSQQDIAAMKYSLDSLPEREIVPGFHGRFVHSASMTFTYWRIEPGAMIPAHSQ